MATEFPIKANTRGAVQDIDALIVAIRKAGKEAGLTEKEIDDITNATRKTRVEGGKNISQLNNDLGGLNKTIKSGVALFASYFSIQQTRAFIGEVVKITAEFQKLEAVLTNTLGSKSQAQQIFAQIKKFASETPFSVLELTQSFVKLANQGFKPSADELRKLGDLSASTGKQFDQLTEAIIDAQTGEFERLKEFGIRASKEGDKVTFTFKGVQTQVDFTADSIREYILTLGDAEGVSGAMEAISKTLGGQISNLGDTWDDLLNTIGDGNSRVLSGTVDLFSDILAGIKSIIITEEQLAELRTQTNRLQGIENFQAFAKAYDDMDKALVQFLADNEKEIEQLRELNDENAKKEVFDQKEADRIFERIERLKDENKAVQEHVDLMKKDAELKEQGERDRIAAEYKERLNKAWEKHNALIEKYNSQLRELTALEEDISVDDKFFERFGTFLSTSKQGFGDLDLSPEAEEGLTDAELAGIQERVDARKEAIDQWKSYTLDAIDEVFQSQVVNTQRELALLDSRYHHELELAGDNEVAKQNINRRFEQERISLLNKQAKQQQQASIFSILANQGPAVAKTAASLGFPAAIPFIAAVLGLFALTLSNQRSIAAPRYAATGDFDIKGPGTETSDSIPYMLSVGESVTPAAKTRRFGWLLRPMIKDKDFSDKDLRHLVDMNLPTEYNPVFVNQAAGADTSELAEEMRLTREAIERKRETHFTMDEEGFNVWVGRDQDWTRRANRRYST